MKNFIAISSLLILLCGCAISNSTHTFTHYGSDSLRDDSDFFYIQHGVLGSASVVYTNRGGGNVRAGLIADAKANMLQQHVLGPNQTYINMSIDIIKTEAGTASGKGVSINSITWTAVISSDIIEYGTAPQEEYTKKNITTGSVDAQINKLIEEVKETESVEEPPALDQRSSDIPFALGDKVIYTKEGKSFDAIVIRVNSSSDTYGLEYTDSEGKTKRRSVKKSELKMN